MERRVKLSALGRVAFIGELYDARTESFSSRSLLKSTRPSELVVTLDINQTEFDYKFTESISDKFELMKIKGELQVSVLLGLVKVEGSGRFLVGEKKSEKSVCCSLICNMDTVCEKFFAPFTEIIEHVDLTALEDLENTHVVTEVYWGARCLLSLTANAESESDKEQLKGQLSAMLQQIKGVLSVKGELSLEKKKSISKISQDLNIKVCADVIPEGSWPTSIEGFHQSIIDFPGLLKKVNNGKGKPLDYVLIPLDSLRKLAKGSIDTNTFVRTIDESFVMSIVFFLEEIAAVKRKMHDLVTEMTDMVKYVMEGDLKAARKQKKDLSVKEADLKTLISRYWVQVKSGEKNLTELVREVEKFKSCQLRLYSYEEYLESTAPTQKKMARVKHFISLGILYLGRGDDFVSLLSKHSASEFLVLVESSQMMTPDEDVYVNTLHYFLLQAQDPQPNTKYVVVDFDYQKEQTFMGVRVTSPRCFHLIGSRILSRDKFSEYLTELSSSFIRLKGGVEVVHAGHKPGNRVALELVCPGFQSGSCAEEPLSWTCFRCKSGIEYGFDGFFYCSCGKGRVVDMEYRCSDPRHVNFIEGKPDNIEKGLSLLRPLKEMNVLILGQSGVGKSTWINSIVNYLNFETLDNAREHGVICTIPAMFPVYDPVTLEKHVLKIGEESSNEVTDIGHSATQSAVTYSFPWQDKCVRLIDSPGLGDTRGIEQDKINLQNIITHIGHLKELHGVCILLKANDTKITTIFSYCLKELLIHLHKSVTKNIVFCFTNARNSLYTPGQASAILEKLIFNLGVEKELALGHHNMFCLDNEAFIFLCSLIQSGINYPQKLIESFADSWELSLKETKRLFDTIKTFEPHVLKETISLVTARHRIMNLAKPIAEISKTIQINLATIKRKQNDILTYNQTLEDLSKKLNYTEVHLEPLPLNYPRTVCTSPSCVEYLPIADTNVNEILYKTHCHVQCYLKNVSVSTVNNSQLRNCDAMGSSGKCKVCGCCWENHMHITYSQQRVEKQAVNKVVEEAMLQEKSEKEKLELLVKELEEKIEQYKKEQEFIVQTSVKFGMFLRSNAITVYNDSVVEYMQYLIREEENKPHKSDTEKNLLQGIKDMLSHYNAEVAILTEVLKKGENSSEELTIDEVLDLEQQLYGLKLMGDSIRKYVECSRSSTSKAYQYMETPLRVPRSKSLKAPKNIVRKENSIAATKPRNPRNIIQSVKNSIGNFIPLKY